MMIDRLLVPAGSPSSASGGFRSAPSQVYFAGSIADSLNAALVTTIWPEAVAVEEAKG